MVRRFGWLAFLLLCLASPAWAILLIAGPPPTGAVGIVTTMAGVGSSAGGGPAVGAPGADYVHISTGPELGAWQPLPDCVLAYDTATHTLGCGVVVSSGSFDALTSGTNTTAAMRVGTGGSLAPVNAGIIVATSMPGEGLSTPVLDAMIPDLNVLSTGLTALKCVETDATGKLVSAAAVCNVGSGGSGVWGGITGTLSSQTDLQTALNAKVPTTTTVNGHALSSNVSVTATDVGLGNVSNTSDAAKNSATAILTNKQIVPRVQLLTVTANHITPNLDNTDVGYNYTFSAGLTIDNPTFTGSNPVDQQLLTLEFKTAAPQTLTWSSMYSSECGLTLPTGTTGDGATYNRFLFRYSSSSTKLCLIASTKGDSTRVTTLAPSTAFTCPADQSDHCEMAANQAAGTITIVAPTGTPANGQFLRIALLCTNAQALSWNAIYVDSATFTKPTTCPADVTKWLSVDYRYSSVLVKWQLLRGEVAGVTIPATVVETDQANTYSTGAQNFANAASLTLPSSAGAAPTASGTMAYDTTQEKPVFGENGMFTSSPARLIYISDAGNSNNGQTGDFLHTGATITFPANYLVQHRSLRMCTLWRFTTLTSPGTLTIKVRLVSPSTDLATHQTGTVSTSRTNVTTAMCWLFVVKDALGSAANTYLAPLGVPASGFVTNADQNGVQQPIAMATNGSITLTMVSRWNTPVAGNIITPDLFTVEALN